MWQGFIQIALTLAIMIAIIPILGSYIAKVFLGQKTFLDSLLNPVEKKIYHLIQIRSQEPMTGWQYAKALLYNNLVMGIFGHWCSLIKGEKRYGVRLRGNGEIIKT